MVFEHIEKLKREFTDKYVVVDLSRPELRRFEGQTGLIKTVNMNGSALVEFDGFENIGWYDIGLDFLTVVDKPLPKKEEPKQKPAKKASAKPAAKAEKPAAKAEKVAAKTEKPAPGGGKLSVAEMLAAARAEKGSDASAAPTAKAETPAAAEASAAKPTGGADAGKMSVADMLAAARAEKSAGTATAEPAAEEQPAEPTSEPEPAAAEEPNAEEAAAAAGDLPKDTAGIIAYCRQRDGS